MAPIGSVIKNGLIFAVLSAGIIYAGSNLIAWGINYASRGAGVGSNEMTQARNFLFAGLSVVLIGVGLVFHKTLSDTVEDGMYEF